MSLLGGIHRVLSMESFLILSTVFLILVCTSLSILVCSLAVDLPTTVFIVNKYHFYNTSAGISMLLIHNARGQVLEPSPSEGEDKTHDRNWYPMWDPWYVEALQIQCKPSSSTAI